MYGKRKCKYRECKKEFEKLQPLQFVCSVKCSISHSKDLKDKKEAHTWKKEKKAIKERLKTKSDYLKELQVVFNRWIRLRDKGLDCISCQKPPKKENAGHYRSVGSTPQLRFHPYNNNLQCEYCNTYLHGNLINYRINLIKKIGLKNVSWLEKEHEPKQYTVDKLKSLKAFYLDKIKELQK